MRKLRGTWLGALALASTLAAAAPDTRVADAAMRGDAGAVRALVTQGADVNAAQGDGMSALHWAAANGDAELARFLVSSGARTTAATRNGGHTPLHVAARAGRGAVVRVLLEAGADPNAVTSTGVTALHQAARAGSLEAVEALVEKGALVDVGESAWEQTPLVFAAAYDRADIIRTLLAHGADPNAYSRIHSVEEQKTVDGAAAAVRREMLTKFRERDGNDPNWRPSPEQVQAAVQAAHAVQRGEVTLAGAGGAEEDLGGGEETGAGATTQGGLTPLLHAARAGNVAASLALIEGGADINQRKKGDSYTALLLALINGHYDLGLMLLEKGADPNLAASDGVAPLFGVISNYWGAKTRYPQRMDKNYQKASYLETMEALLKAGADPNARMRQDQWYLIYTFGGLGVDMAGATAFWRAAHAVDVPAMRLLVKYGADPNLATLVPAQAGRGRGGAGGGTDPSGMPPVVPGGPAVYPIHAASGVGYGAGSVGNFHLHADNGWLPAVKYLVDELGADVNARDPAGYTPLHNAAARGDNEMILYLVSKGADVMAVNRAGQTTVDMANGPRQRQSPIFPTIALLESLGAKNNHRCVSC